MQLEIETNAMPADQEWRELIERHCSLTLRPLGQSIKRVAVTLEHANQNGLPYFVSDLQAKTSRRPIHVRIRHANAYDAIALAFARAKRELVRQFDA